MVFLVSKQGLKQISEVSTSIMIYLFVVQYFNTGILFMFSNANLENSFLSFLLMHNKYDDFTQDWYLEIGPQIVATMVIDSMMP